MASKGGQPENQNAAKNKPWHNALNRAILRPEGKDRATALDRIAKALIKSAESGDVQAIKEVGDRIDGKVPQGIDAKIDANVIVNIKRFAGS